MTDTAGRDLTGSRRRLTVGLVLAVTMFAFEALAITTVMPAVTDDLGGIDLYGAAFSAFMLAQIVGIAIAGHEADSRGPAPVLGAGTAIFALGLVTGGIAPSMAALVGSRILQGLGAGVVAAAVYVGIAVGFAPRERSRVFAVMSAAWIVPALVGPGLAGVVAEHLHWRWVFLGLLPMPVIVAVLALPTLAGTTPERRLPPQRGVAAAALRLSIGTGLLLVLAPADISMPVWLRVGAATAGAVVGLPAARRLLPRGMWSRQPGVPTAVASRGLLTASFFAADSFIPLALTGVHGRSTVFVGFVLTVSALAWALGAWLQSTAAERRSLGSIARAGFTVQALGVALVAPVVLDLAGPWLAIAAWSIAGLGMGVAFNSLTVVAMNSAPDDRAGRTSASLQIADALGIAVATGVGGLIVSAGESNAWALPSTLGWVWLAVAAATIAGLWSSRPVAELEPGGGGVSLGGGRGSAGR